MRITIGLLLGGLLVGAVACADEEVEDAAVNTTVNGNCVRSRALTVDKYDSSSMADLSIALTFDDGPSEITSELSAYLRNEGIPATFFVNGMHIPGRESVLDRQVADGHLLGNHTHTHAALTELTSSIDIIQEVARTDWFLSTRVPEDKLFFRPPYGAWNETVAKTLAGTSMNKYQGPVGWDIGGELTWSTAADWDCWDRENGRRTVKQCGELYLKEIRSKRRGVVLLHDGPPGGNAAKTLRMIKYIVPILKAEGYAFERIDTMLPKRISASQDDAGTPETSTTTTPDAGSQSPSYDPCD